MPAPVTDPDHRAIVETCPDGLLWFDRDGTCLFATARAAHLLGRDADLVPGLLLSDLLGDDTGTALAAVAQARTEARCAEALVRLNPIGGEQRWMELRVAAPDQNGTMTAVLRDVTLRHTAELALRVANAELGKLAGSDVLTDLANRRKFDETLETECRRASRHNAPLSLLLVDVDRFKAFNDHYGHPAGDACLKRVAGVVRAQAARPADLAARLGGEEFVMLLPETGEQDAVMIAERVRAAVCALAIAPDAEADAGSVLTVSIGCATARPTPESLGSVGAGLIADADRALYDAKRLGRNRVVASATSPLAELTADDARVNLIAAYRAAAASQGAGGLDHIARIAAVLLGMPISFVALLDRAEVAVVGRHGVPQGAAIAYDWCAHLLGARSAVVVPDVAANPRFRAAWQDCGFGFVAAAPLLLGDDLQHIGALWVADRQRRAPLDDTKRVLLSHLAGLATESLQAHARLSAPLSQMVA